MRLRGYDEYEVTLGDEMRGERASLGKTLQNAERDLRIKARVIRAIEDCDLDGFPNDSVVAGYVRSYSRYLGLNPEDCYRRFCAESGFRSPSSTVGGFDSRTQSGGIQNIVAAGAALGTGLTQSRFAVKSTPVRFGARISLGGLTSAMALVGLIAGLGYGGYALLQDIQRVGFTPLPEAPEVVAEAPVIATPTVDGGLLKRPDAAAYETNGVLATMTLDELPPPSMPVRDGPISAIDPATSGVFRDPVRDVDPSIAAGAAPKGTGPMMAEAGVVPVTEVAAVVPSGPPQIVIHATDTAWIRVRDGDEVTVFQGTLAAGDQFTVPERVAVPLLRVGNAGAIYVSVNGAPYGPVGASGQVVKNLSLAAADIELQVPVAQAGAIGTGDAALERAAAVLPQ